MREYGSEFSISLLGNNYFDFLKPVAADAKYIRCGRDSIGYVADEVSNTEKAVLMPAYCCSSMTDPFKVRKWVVVYYPLNQNLTPNENELKRLINDHNPKILFIMNYFGFVDNSLLVKNIKKLCPHITIVEDFTHTLFSLHKDYNQNVDYYICSIRKWMGIPDGAVAVSTQKPFNAEPLFFDNEFVSLRTEALTLKEDYFYTKKDETKQKYRKLFLHADESLDDGRVVCAMSHFSRKIFHDLNIQQIAKARKVNYEHLSNLLRNSNKLNLLSQVNRKDISCPFSVPILVDNRDEIQLRLVQKGVFAPVLWPIDDEAKKTCYFSKEISETLLSVPIDQRYGYADIERIAEIIIDCI